MFRNTSDLHILFAKSACGFIKFDQGLLCSSLYMHLQYQLILQKVKGNHKQTVGHLFYLINKIWQGVFLFLLVSGKGCGLWLWHNLAFMRTGFLCISVLRVASESRVKVATCKSALNLPVVYSTDRSKAVIPVLVLLFVALWFLLRGDLFYALSCVILFFCCCFFSPFSIAITSLGEERTNLNAFRTFVRFAHVSFCLFPLPLGVWEGLRFVTVALPGLFSYPFL